MAQDRWIEDIIQRMISQFLYFEDPLKFEFEAVVRQKIDLPGGRTGVLLDRTYFYPEGGGQEHDTGTIGEARVVEVYKEGDEPRVIHVLDQEIALGPALARIDPDRRLRNMQHHTAQHLLTQCFLRLFDLETESAHINGFSPSTLDLPLSSLQKHDLERAEDLANQIIYEDRAVKSYFVTPEEFHRLPLRRTPSVTENIRIVEIDSFDYTPCGGTHCPTTGMIGVIKVLKTERQNDKTRVVFIAGRQALEYFREYQDIVTGVAGQLSLHPRDILPTVARQAEQLRSAQKELQELRLKHIALEAREMAGDGETIGACQVILDAFDHRPIEELRALAGEFRKMSRVVAVLSTYDGQKASLVVACSEDTGVSASELLRRQLASIGGRGGGDHMVAQGGGAATESQFRELLENARSVVLEMLPKNV
jgi:alanyl-tRNA synthetase